jgi:hypothetical protein
MLFLLLLHIEDIMSVPVDPLNPCISVEADLFVCQARLAAAGSAVIPVWTTSPSSVTRLPEPVPTDQSKLLMALIGCSVLMGMLVFLHIARQAWYIWGGEGAYAFPYDK